jgi:hypothetical protein
MPTVPTPGRSIRVADELWQPFADACAARGLTTSDVLREWISGYLAAKEVADERGDDLNEVIAQLLNEYTQRPGPSH